MKSDSSNKLLGWRASDVPPALTTPTLEFIGMEPLYFREPVLIDFMSGIVFMPPAEIPDGNEGAWNKLTCADSPLALAEKDTLYLAPFDLKPMCLSPVFGSNIMRDFRSCGCVVGLLVAEVLA